MKRAPGTGRIVFERKRVTCVPKAMVRRAPSALARNTPCMSLRSVGAVTGSDNTLGPLLFGAVAQLRPVHRVAIASMISTVCTPATSIARHLRQASLAAKSCSRGLAAPTRCWLADQHAAVPAQAGLNQQYLDAGPAGRVEEVMYARCAGIGEARCRQRRHAPGAELAHICRFDIPNDQSHHTFLSHHNGCKLVTRSHTETRGGFCACLVDQLVALAQLPPRTRMMNQLMSTAARMIALMAPTSTKQRIIGPPARPEPGWRIPRIVPVGCHQAHPPEMAFQTASLNMGLPRGPAGSA